MTNIEQAEKYFIKADKAAERGDYLLAVNNYQEAVKLKPDFAEAYYFLANLQNHNFNDFDMAEENYNKAIKYKKDFAEAYFQLGSMQFIHQKEYQKAKKNLVIAIEKKQDYIPAYTNLAHIQIMYLNEFDEAKEILFIAKELKKELKYDDAIILNTLASLQFIHYKEFDNAKENFEKSILYNPDSFEACMNYSNLLINHFQEYDRAKELLEKAIKLNPESFLANFNYASLLIKYFNESKNAKIYFLKSIELNNIDERPRKALDSISFFLSQTFITEFDIKNVRHHKNLNIHLSKTEKKHLLFTGKNGSGKTSVLKEAREYLGKLLEIPVDVLFSVDGEKKILDEADAGNLKFGISDSLIDLKLKYETGNLIVAYFPARRELKLHALERLPKNINIPITSKITDKLNNDLIDYYWNLKTQSLLALESENKVNKNKFDSLINSFVEKFKIIDSRIKEVKFTADKGKYNIEFIPEEPFEKFDFSTLADGYASIFDFISEIILRMSHQTDDVFNLEGIVLIDEPETHLHIEMQKEVLPILSGFFPRVQFIVATHSPYVVGSIQNSVVYDLETHIRTEKLSAMPVEKITEYLDLEKEEVVEYEKEITEFEELLGQLKTGKITDHQGRRIAELDLKLNKSVPLLSDESFVKFKNLQKELY